MISHLHSTTIVVADQEEALDFYVGVLGWEKRQDNTMGPDFRFLTVAPASAQTSVVLGTPASYGRPPGGPTGISLITDDIGRTHAELTAQGVSFSAPPERMPWGDLGAHFSDPFGNEFFLVELATAS